MIENDIIYAFNSTFYTLCLFVSIYFALSLRISHWSRAWHEKNTHIYTILYFILFVIVCSLFLSFSDIQLHIFILSIYSILFYLYSLFSSVHNSFIHTFIFSSLFLTYTLCFFSVLLFFLFQTLTLQHIPNELSSQSNISSSSLFLVFLILSFSFSFLPYISIFLPFFMISLRIIIFYITINSSLLILIILFCTSINN